MKSAFLGYRLGHRVFPGNICISLNDEIVHGIGSQRRIQYGDIVKLDIGVIQDGWVGDTASTVAVGMIDERTEQLLRVTENALRRAIESAFEGVRLGDVCAAIEAEAVAQSIFSVVREFVGHGVGRKLHEEPQVPNYGKRGSGPKLKAGMTLAIEPMINAGTAAVRLLDDGWTVCTADGMRSAHFEHTVLITKDAAGDPHLARQAAAEVMRSAEAHVGHNSRLQFIRVLRGGKVLLEVSPYDLSKGRITFRRVVTDAELISAFFVCKSAGYESSTLS